MGGNDGKILEKIIHKKNLLYFFLINFIFIRGCIYALEFHTTKDKINYLKEKKLSIEDQSIYKLTFNKVLCIYKYNKVFNTFPLRIKKKLVYEL